MLLKGFVKNTKIHSKAHFQAKDHQQQCSRDESSIYPPCCCSSRARRPPWRCSKGTSDRTRRTACSSSTTTLANLCSRSWAAASKSKRRGETSASLQLIFTFHSQSLFMSEHQLSEPEKTTKFHSVILSFVQFCLAFNQWFAALKRHLWLHLLDTHHHCIQLFDFAKLVFLNFTNGKYIHSLKLNF